MLYVRTNKQSHQLTANNVQFQACSFLSSHPHKGDRLLTPVRHRRPWKTPRLAPSKTPCFLSHLSSTHGHTDHDTPEKTHGSVLMPSSNQAPSRVKYAGTKNNRPETAESYRLRTLDDCYFASSPQQKHFPCHAHQTRLLTHLQRPNRAPKNMRPTNEYAILPQITC